MLGPKYKQIESKINNYKVDWILVVILAQINFKRTLVFSKGTT